MDFRVRSHTICVRKATTSPTSLVVRAWSSPRRPRIHASVHGNHRHCCEFLIAPYPVRRPHNPAALSSSHISPSFLPFSLLTSSPSLQPFFQPLSFPTLFRHRFLHYSSLFITLFTTPSRSVSFLEQCLVGTPDQLLKVSPVHDVLIVVTCSLSTTQTS